MRIAGWRPIRTLLSLGLAAAIGLAIDAGAQSAPDEPATPSGGSVTERAGLWRKIIPPSGPRDQEPAPSASSSQPLSPQQRRQIAALEAIGYLDGTEPNRPEHGVTVHDRTRAQPGLNFYTSGHAAEAVLCDMDGRVLHRWAYDFHDIWPDRPIPARKDYWRRAKLFENGDVIAIYEGWGIIRIDANSKLIWANPIRAHHDLQVMPNGEIYVLTRRARLVPRINPKLPIIEDFISVLGPDGQQKAEMSLLEAVEQSPAAKLLFDGRALFGDLLHTNSIEILRDDAADSPWHRAGNALVSFLMIDTIGVIDMKTGRLVKAWQGEFRAQHDPRLLDDGNLMLFDNQGRHRASSVIEFDPRTEAPVWSYRGGIDGPFYSQFCGTAARLPNGNTLITESGRGRAFEVTPKKEIVWEFDSPHHAGASGEYVASLLELVRLPADFPTPYLEPGPQHP